VSDYSPAWLDGCALFQTEVFLFQGTHITSWLIKSNLRSELINHPVETMSMTLGPWLIRYPRSISLADCATLSNPRILHSSPIRLHLLYDAKSPTEAGPAFLEISHPNRLHNPCFRVFASHPRPGVPPITWSPIPPADKSSPSAPECARAPSSSP
jgi:hypothetical protein